MNFKKQTKPKQTPDEEKLYQSQCMHRERDRQMQHRGHKTTPTTGGRLVLASGKDYPSRTLAETRSRRLSAQRYSPRGVKPRAGLVSRLLSRLVSRLQP